MSMPPQIALAITPLVIGYTRNRSPDYDNVESLLLAGACATLLLCLLLGCINSNRRGSRGHLNAPTYATIQSPGSIAVRLPPGLTLPVPRPASVLSARELRPHLLCVMCNACAGVAAGLAGEPGQVIAARRVK